MRLRLLGLAFALLPGLAGAQAASVVAERVGEEVFVTVEAPDRLGPVWVDREGPDFVLRFAAGDPPVSLPPAVSPIEALAAEVLAEGWELRVTVPADVPYQVRRSVASFALVLSAPPPPPAAPPDIRDLYALLFPVPQLGALGPEAAPTEDSGEGEREGGIRFGPFNLRPGVTIASVDSEASLVRREPVPDSHFLVQPALGVGLWESDRLRIHYEPRFRRASSFDIVETTSHELSIDANLPLGAYVMGRGAYRFTKGVLETNEVDPGREYFFGLGPYERRLWSAGLRLDRGGRADLDVDASMSEVDVEEANFFSSESRSLRAGLGYELTPTLRTQLSYGYQHTPRPPDRPEAESTAHSFTLDFDGELAPLVSGNGFIGYRRQTNPNARGGSRDFSGLTFGAGITKEFGPASSVRLSGTRSTYASFFEANGYYVSTGGQLELVMPLPFWFSFTGGLGYQTNSYPLEAAGSGEPRKDEIFAWSLGLGRAVTRHAFLRIDFRKERRDSNLEAFETDSHAFIVMLGIGFQRGASR